MKIVNAMNIEQKIQYKWKCREMKEDKRRKRWIKTQQNRKIQTWKNLNQKTIEVKVFVIHKNHLGMKNSEWHMSIVNINTSLVDCVNKMKFDRIFGYKCYFISRTLTVIFFIFFFLNFSYPYSCLYIARLFTRPSLIRSFFVYFIYLLIYTVHTW